VADSACQRRVPHALRDKHQRRSFLISEALLMSAGRRSAPQISTDLLARHIAATFVLVLDWWVDTDAALTPKEIDVRFRSLVAPVLTAL
jgi:hypothetical protein